VEATRPYAGDALRRLLKELQMMLERCEVPRSTD